MSMHSLETRYNNIYSHRSTLLKQVKRYKVSRSRLVKEIVALEKCQVILTEASKIAQAQMKKKIEALITIAIRGVFERPLAFKLIFEDKRKHIEARPLILEGENEYIPKDDLGGGVIDIISFAFRLVLWHLSNPKSHNLFVLDEPFKFTGVLVEKAGEMLQYLSKKLGFQVLIISHDEELINICDRLYRIRHDGTESKVKLVKGGKKIKRRR